MRLTLLLLFCSTSVLISQDVVEDTVGEFATNFIYRDATGIEHALIDHQGEVVYLSFWASWCKPCIAGFEKYKDVRREMHAKGVIMLNISIDKNVDSWNTAMEKYDIIGHHGHAPQEDIIAEYQLYNIPRYEIIGKQGQFLYLDREHGKTVMQNFEAFLKS